ncbi:MAG: hypothetical protein ACE5G1_11070 [bacterium]
MPEKIFFQAYLPDSAIFGDLNFFCNIFDVVENKPHNPLVNFTFCKDRIYINWLTEHSFRMLSAGGGHCLG